MAQRILIIDDHPLCSTALAMAARIVEPAIVVDVATTMAQAEILVGRERHDLILLDLVLPDVLGLTGLALMRALRPRTPLAIVSSREGFEISQQTASLGAVGFVAKSEPIDRMVEAIRILLDGGTWFVSHAPLVALSHEKSEDSFKIGSLTVAQLRVLRAAASGRLTKQIAFELNLSEATVKSHLATIFRKLQVSNRTQAILMVQHFDRGAN